MALVRSLILLMAVLGFAAACSSGGKSASSGALKLTVTTRELEFGPTTLTVQAGRPVEITVKNIGTSEHDFVIDNLPAVEVHNDLSQDVGGQHSHGPMGASQIHGHVQPRRSVRVGFVPMQPGRYEFYCSLPGHRDGGMHGTLIVA